MGYSFPALTRETVTSDCEASGLYAANVTLYGRYFFTPYSLNSVSSTPLGIVPSKSTSLSDIVPRLTMKSLYTTSEE